MGKMIKNKTLERLVAREHMRVAEKSVSNRGFLRGFQVSYRLMVRVRIWFIVRKGGDLGLYR